MNPLDYLPTISIAYAQGATTGTFTPLATFIGKIDRYIVNPLIVLLFAGALAYFFYGVLQFLIKAGNPEEREAGKSHMIWGIVGMFIMFSVFVILRIIETTLGIPNNANIPT